MATFQDTPCYSAKLSAALSYAADIHAYQTRKQGGAYLSHLLQVMGLVIEAGGNEDEAIAALLHDAIEDIIGNPDAPGYKNLTNAHSPYPASYQYYLAEVLGFGYEVAEIVDRLSEDKTVSVEDRKQGYVNAIRMSSDSVVLISAADKLHNLRCYATGGRHLWKPETKEFYDKLTVIYRECDRIPAHWIEEFDRLLLGMEEETVTIARSRYESLKHWSDVGHDWDREFPDSAEEKFDDATVIYFHQNTLKLWKQIYDFMMCSEPGFPVDDHVATKEQYMLADRCVGSIFEALSPGDVIQLKEGFFELDQDLDPHSISDPDYIDRIVHGD